MSLIRRLLRYEAIDGDGVCPVYLHRWTLLKLGRRLTVYLHHFVGNDWALDPHDHPKRFISIGLAGEYWEDLFHPEGVRWGVRHWSAPWFRSFAPEHIHRVRIWPEGQEAGTRRRAGAWTICIVGRTRRSWGFWFRGTWVKWNEYVWGGLGAARKDC